MNHFVPRGSWIVLCLVFAACDGSERQQVSSSNDKSTVAAQRESDPRTTNPDVTPVMTNPDEQNPWVIRTEFSDDKKWSAVRELVAAPQVEFDEKFYAYVKYVSDKKYAGMEPETLVHSLPDDYPGFLCFIVDETTLDSEEHPILVVGFSPNSVDAKDYERTPKQTPSTDIRTFRAIPSTIQSIENNLSIANMDFEDFADSVSPADVCENRNVSGTRLLGSGLG